MAGNNPTRIPGSLRRLWNYAGAPTSGTSGTYAGSAEPGDLLVDDTNGIVYENKNTKASPTWIPTGVPTVTEKTADTAALTVAEAGVIEANADDIYLYLPTYIGYAGLTYMIKCLASYSAGVSVWPYSAAEKIDGAASKTSGAQYDALIVIAGTYGWNIVSQKGTWS